MDLGEQLTNVLSCNNFASISYEYFEPQSPSFGTSKSHLQKIESAWRQDGTLAYYDPDREGIWTFQPSPNSPNKTIDDGVDMLSLDNTFGVEGLQLVRMGKGTYEPANLAKSKLMITNSLGTPSSTSSPSSNDNMIRNASSFNARAVQANSTQSVYEITASSPSVKSAGMDDSFSSMREIQEHFISSVLASVVYSLCRDHGCIPLNSRTLILSQNASLSSDSTITLVNLDISLTSLGTLVIKALCGNAPGLQSIVSSGSLGNLPRVLFPGTALWLAPGGTLAKFHSFHNEEQSSDTQTISDLQKASEEQSWRFQGTTIKAWQSRCLEWLSTKGLDSSLIEKSGWVFVQVLKTDPMYSSPEYADLPLPDDGAIVPWPVLLCFRTIKTSSPELQSFSANSFGVRDPLCFAEEWFTTEDKRASMLIERQNERKVLEATKKERAEKEANSLQASNHPVALLEKGSNAGAMYPTPPDAIHHPVGVTPSFDGAVSTPGNPSQLFAHDMEATNSSNVVMTATDADQWGSSEAKHRPISNMNFSVNDNDNDNLFGDMGGDLFGDADITDADFNFFDQPDAIQLDHPPASPVIPALFPSQQSNAVEKPSISSRPLIEQPVSRDMVMKDLKQLENSAQPTARQQHLEVPSNEVHMQNSINSPGLVVPSLPPPRITMPFDKESVFRQIQHSSALSYRQPRKASVYDKVEFENSLTTINEKYGQHGRFSYAEDEMKLERIDSHDLTKPKKFARQMSEKNIPLQDKLASILNNEGGQYDLQLDDEEMPDLPSDSDIVSDASDSDEALPTTTSIVARLGMKRKRYNDDDHTGSIGSYNAMGVDYEPSTGTPRSVIEPQLPLFDSDPAAWSLTPYVTSPEPDIQPNGLSDHECIATAQILADQAATGNLRLYGEPSGDFDTPSQDFSATGRLMSGLFTATNTFLKGVQNCNMRSYLDIQGIPAINPALRLPPRPTPIPRAGQHPDPSRSSNPFPIPPPQLEVRRGDSKLAVLPPAIYFWDNLGLAPFTGSKDVNAVCIHPNVEGVAENADYFLDQMRGAYESFRFGSHDRIISQDLPNSLMNFPIDGNNQANSMLSLASLKDTMGRLSRILSTLSLEERNIVVYFIYPIDNSPLLVHICSAFKHLFDLYRKSLLERKIKAINELVLQLVPMNFLASSTSLVVPSPTEYSRLAMEVYDRSVDFASPSSTSAILLERPLPKSIEFKWSANPSPSLLQENSCLHIAYAQSVDDRWITAAWSDNRGTTQMTASYCLGRKNEPLTLPFAMVANEIWETTLDVISKKKIHWRIIIAKAGAMDQSEVDFWTGLHSTESNAQTSLTLVTVQTDPSLRLLPPSLKFTPTTTTTSQSAITPVSTPQGNTSSLFSPDNPSTPSRDQATNVQTPLAGEVPLEQDPNFRLVDYTDQSWGAILSHRLNNNNSLLEYNPALISGYLIKNGGTSTEDSPIIMEVNIIHAEVTGNPRIFHENLLREILGYYRGLATLARARGVVHPVKDGRPWHIAAAEKAVKALYMLI